MIVVTVFQQSVQSGDAQLGATFLDFFGDVGGSLEQNFNAGKCRDGAGVAPAVGTQDGQTASAEKIQGRLMQRAVAGQDQAQSRFFFGCHCLPLSRFGVVGGLLTVPVDDDDLGHAHLAGIV